MSELVGIWNLNPSIKWENESQLDKIGDYQSLIYLFLFFKIHLKLNVLIIKMLANV